MKKYISLLFSFLLLTSVCYGERMRAENAGGSVSDTVYGAGWNGDTTVAPSKNAVYDKIETLLSSASIDTSAELAAILTDETGTGAAVFAGSPTLTGTATIPTINIGSATGVSATAAAGVLTLAGIGGTNNENLLLNFEGTANIVRATTATAANLILQLATGVNATLYMYDSQKFVIGNGNDSAFEWTTVGNDNLQLGLAVGSAPQSGYLSLMEYADIDDVDRSPLATSVNPVLRIYSADATSATDYGEFYQDGTNFNIGLGEGTLNTVIDSANTATVAELHRITATSTGTVAANFGAGIDAYLEDSSGNAAQQASRIATIWTDATEASEDSAIVFSGVSAGGALTEWGRMYGASSGTGGVLEIDVNGITTNSQILGILLNNTTLSTSGVTRQHSPALIFAGHEWTGGAEQEDRIAMVLEPDTYSNPKFSIYAKEGAGAYSKIWSLDSGGSYATAMSFDSGAAGESLELGAKYTRSGNATASADTYSPYIHLRGKGWKTAAPAASQEMGIGWVNAHEQGVVNPVGVSKWFYVTNGSTPVESNELYRLEWGDRLGVVFNEQGADQDFRIESDTITNALAVDGATGDVTIGGALAIPNGANPTVDAAGEIAVDTSAAPGSGIRFYGDAAYTIAGTYSKSFVITSPTDSADAAIWRVPYNITIKAIHGVQVGGTNVVGTLTECDSNGLNPVVVDSADMTITTSNVNDDGSLSNPTIDAGDYLGWATTSVSGTITRVTITFEYTIDQVN